MTPDQWAELISAVRALRPSALTIWIPVITGFGGAMLGFSASLLKDWIARAVGRRQSLASDILDRRRDAVNALLRDAVKWADQWAGLENNRREHHESNRTIAAMFLVTGVPADELLQRATVRFLDAMEESVFTFSTGAIMNTYTNRWTDEIHDSYRAITTALSERAEVWLRRSAPPSYLADFMTAQIPTLNQMRDASLAARELIAK